MLGPRSKDQLGNDVTNGCLDMVEGVVGISH